MVSDRTGQSSDRRRLTVPEAAEALGVTADAVRGRIRRGILEAEWEAGTVYDFLDLGESDRREPSWTSRTPSDDQSELVAQLLDRVASLERQLERHWDETERLHQIVARLAQANADQAHTIRATGAPASEEVAEAAETVETVEEEPESSAPVRCARPSDGRTEASELVAAHLRRIGEDYVLQRQKNNRPGRGVARRDLWRLARDGSLRHAAGSHRWCSARRSSGNGIRTNLGASKPLTSPQTAAQRRLWWSRMFGG